MDCGSKAAALNAAAKLPRGGCRRRSESGSFAAALHIIS